jgi:hypothetical protein
MTTDENPPERPMIGRAGKSVRFGDVPKPGTYHLTGMYVNEKGALCYTATGEPVSITGLFDEMKETALRAPQYPTIADWAAQKGKLNMENEEVLRRRIERARRDIDEFTERLTWLESLPEEPETPEDGDGPVIFFRKRFGDAQELFLPEGGYQYAAVKCEPDKWFITGKHKIDGGLTWRELLAFIFMKETEETSPAIWIATNWEQL